MLNYKDILKGFHTPNAIKFLSGKTKKEKLKKKLDTLVKTNRVDVLSTIVSDLGEVFTYPLNQIKIEGVNTENIVQHLCDFLEVIPDDLCGYFIDKIGAGRCDKDNILNNIIFLKRIRTKLSKYARLFR